MGCNEDGIISILTLGDGDFTYSLDLAKYLSITSSAGNTGIRLVASGIDSKEELLKKYRDSPFVLRRLVDFSSPVLAISVEHGVNAILDTTVSEPNQPIGKVDHVMFHHPHLGTEDALLHSQFLYHFFHSCVNGWMKASMSFVHVSLVVGQCERWKCLEAARSQGLVLLQRTPFVPPPVENPCYHFRRHQTGKSFESRTSGSETFIFGRNESLTTLMQLLSRGIFSWTSKATAQRDGNDERTPPSQQNRFLPCPQCDREFKEQRSLKCHMRDVHPDGPEKRCKRTNIFECEECRTVTAEGVRCRSFETEQALKDHHKAKHSALHTKILPDWCHAVVVDDEEGKKVAKNEKNANTVCTCSICGAGFDSCDAMASHLECFTPPSSTEIYRCAFCGKGFREARASFQHENFCQI